jgi:hypothetical protein
MALGVSAKSTRLLPLLAMLLFGCVLPIGALVGLYTQDCARRESTVPEHPVYANAKLLSQSTMDIPLGGKGTVISTTGAGHPFRLWAMMEKQHVTLPSADRTRCEGEATPFGNYLAYPK